MHKNFPHCDQNAKTLDGIECFHFLGLHSAYENSLFLFCLKVMVVFHVILADERFGRFGESKLLQRLYPF